MARILFIFFGLLLTTHFPPCSAAVIKGIDLFGSDTLTVEKMIDAEPRLFESFCQKLENEEIVSQELSDRLKQKFSLAYVRLAAITYFEDQERVVYITFDVVEAKDALKRLSFQEQPQEGFEDPTGLIAAWDLYMNTGWELTISGEIDAHNVKCSAFHYIFGHQHPKLAPFEKIFIEGATKYKDLLIDIFLRDRDDNKRAVAAFLLAYTTDGQELVAILSKRLRDPSGEVRNNVMRVFAIIAEDHPEISLPVDEVLLALHFPDTTDRNKAAAIIHGILSHEASFREYRQKILDSSLETLLKMADLKQPNNQKWACQILDKICNPK